MAEDTTFKETKETISSALIETTRTAGQIAGEDLAFHRSSNPEITPLLEKQNTRLLNLAQNLVRVATTGTEVSAPRLSDVDSVEDNWSGIVDVIDNLLEKADACLDEYTGVIKRLAPSQETQPAVQSITARKTLRARDYRDQNIPKPQLLFKNIPTNDETTAFKPLLRSKSHAIVPLKESLELTTYEDGIKQYDIQFYLSQKDVAPALKQLIDSHIRYKHPYETEISQSTYPASIYIKSDPIPYPSLESTKATFVDTPEAVATMLEELKKAKEIAVDLEHHDTHSYIGLVSLMQISTRKDDWIVDTLKPWREDLQVLNEVFADPNILKVFHGSSMDVIWLQRDLGLYVVGLFDTYHASHALGYTKHSLASLLTRFVNFEAEKKYQMADWRMRPLPEPMFDYARSDTHFLLYIYDNMRNELIERSNPQPDGNLINTVLNRSKEEALQRYERPFYDAQRGTGPMGWYHLLSRTPALFNGQQLAVFRAIHQWRDTVARREDESIHHIVSKQALFNIAREMPVNKASLLGCAQPFSKLLLAHANELLSIIKEAKDAGVNGPPLKELIHARKLEARTADNDGQAVASTGIDPAFPLGPQISPGKLPIRTNQSQFWGPTIGRAAWHDLRPSVQTQHGTDSLRLAIPLPQLTAQVFDDKNSVATGSSEIGPGACAEHQYAKGRKTKKNDIFIVKQLGGPRKRKVGEMREAPESAVATIDDPQADTKSQDPDDEMEITLVDATEEQLAHAKADHKAQRKAQKKLEKEERKREKLQPVNGEGNDEGQDEVEAFDYANAPSVLHAKRDSHERTGPKKAFDPYAKSLDAPKGMRKSHKEIAGKSFTFKH